MSRDGITSRPAGADLSATQDRDLEVLIQAAGEEAYNALDIDEGDCGCETCIVREVLEGAWEPLLELAKRHVRREQEQAST